jgi:hypothetical protein
VAIVNGLASATRCSHGVICSVSTNAEETNVNGNIHRKPAELAASTDLTDSPISAWIQLKL